MSTSPRSHILFMYKPIKFIAEIPNINYSTYYFFCKQSNTIMPIELLEGINSHLEVPSIYDSITRIIRGVGYSAKSVKIYRQEFGVFYTYLSIQRDKEVFDINIGFKDAMNIARETCLPVYVEDSILKINGFVINKNMVLKALEKEG